MPTEKSIRFLPPKELLCNADFDNPTAVASMQTTDEVALNNGEQIQFKLSNDGFALGIEIARDFYFSVETLEPNPSVYDCFDPTFPLDGSWTALFTNALNNEKTSLTFEQRYHALCRFTATTYARLVAWWNENVKPRVTAETLKNKRALEITPPESAKKRAAETTPPQAPPAKKVAVAKAPATAKVVTSEKTPAVDTIKEVAVAKTPGATNEPTVAKTSDVVKKPIVTKPAVSATEPVVSNDIPVESILVSTPHIQHVPAVTSTPEIAPHPQQSIVTEQNCRENEARSIVRFLKTPTADRHVLSPEETAFFERLQAVKPDITEYDLLSAGYAPRTSEMLTRIEFIEQCIKFYS